MPNSGQVRCASRITPHGFTLLEVVLAIGLAGTVVGLLATALELYLMRVDANRTRVESAQLARALINQIAEDIRAARFWSPRGGGGGGEAGDSGGQESAGETLGSGGESSDDAENDTPEATDIESAGQALGIFGTAAELRIDRATRWQWERTTRVIDPALPTSADEMPQTVVYFFGDGDTLLADRLAALGVLSDAALPGYAGLYRQESATAAWTHQNTATGVSIASTAQATAELIAPEVLALEFAYFDGTQMVAEWDSAAQGRLPRGVEIRLTMLQQPYELALAETPQEREALLRSAENAVEYRHFVRLPNLRPRRVEGQRRRGRDNSQQQSQQAGGTQAAGGANDAD